MTVLGLSFLLAAIISAALSAAMLIRGGRNRLYLSFSGLNGTLFLYYLSAFIHEPADDGIWFRLNVLAALIIPPTAIRFFTLFLGQTGGFAAKARQTALTVSILLAPFVFSELVNRYIIKLIVIGFVFAALIVCMLMLLERLRHTTSRVESVRLKYLLYGGMVAVVFSMTEYLPALELAWFPALGNMLTVIYMYFLSQIIIQYRLLDLNELVGKMLVLATLVTVLATIYTLTGLFVSDIPGLIFFNTFIAGFVVLILFDPINGIIENKVNRLLFRERYEFGRQLALLRRELQNVIDVAQMAQLVLTRLENSRRVTSASIHLHDEDSGDLRCQGYFGPPPAEAIDVVTERPFLERVQEAKALVVESIEAEQRELMTAGHETDLAEVDALNEILRVMQSLESDVSIAMLSEDRVIGVLNVRDDRMSESYSPEEIAHLAAIASQCTICVENSRIVSRIRDRDRLAAIGEMAAGLAHEVRNPLGAIKGAAQMLADEDEPQLEGDIEFIEIIVEEVNRLNEVVSAFLDYARPYDGSAEPTDVNQVVERVATLVRGPAGERGVEIALDLGRDVPQARIDSQVLRQVVWNLCLNAIDAVEEATEKRIAISTRAGRQPAPAHAGYFGIEAVELTIKDTGVGIEPGDIERIFIPFFTTKARGTGLGLAICQRMVRAAGGTITAVSRPGEGATFTIRLPLVTDDVTASSQRKRLSKTELRQLEGTAPAREGGE